jgi:xylulose-5-phosphate/fructose-6-phosphate phosphoketolase
MHRLMATTLEPSVELRSSASSTRARSKGDPAATLADDRPQFPERLDRTRSGRWLQIEGDLPRAPGARSWTRTSTPSTCKMLEDWLRSYRPEELFDGQGRLRPELAELAPKGERAWAPTLTPMAVCCCAIWSCRTFATMR